MEREKTKRKKEARAAGERRPVGEEKEPGKDGGTDQGREAAISEEKKREKAVRTGKEKRTERKEYDTHKDEGKEEKSNGDEEEGEATGGGPQRADGGGDRKEARPRSWIEMVEDEEREKEEAWREEQEERRRRCRNVFMRGKEADVGTIRLEDVEETIRKGMWREIKVERIVSRKQLGTEAMVVVEMSDEDDKQELVARRREMAAAEITVGEDLTFWESKTRNKMTETATKERDEGKRGWTEAKRILIEGIGRRWGEMKKEWEREGKNGRGGVRKKRTRVKGTLAQRRVDPVARHCARAPAGRGQEEEAMNKDNGKRRRKQKREKK